jgi:hypothetical protein
VRRIGPPLALLVVLLAITPASALAKKHRPRYKPTAQVNQVWYECTHQNSITGHFPASVLEQAAAHLPSTEKEYSLCENEIQNAENQLVDHSRPPPAQTSTQKQHNAANAGKHLRGAVQTGGKPVNLGGQRIVAGVVGYNGSVFSDLPTPLLIVILVLLALGSIPAGLRVQKIVRARRSR